ncbi:MAG TPA: efflux RND transporter periplasmic adaptor subunit [Polyangiales bacterium]|nr:efflux RND transporter periplasmic adaptor subunit [Polyangiales bacterium]
MTLKDPRVLAVLATSALVLTIGTLAVQHVRHGWPFSLHHGMAISPAAPATAPRSEAAAAPSHARAEVELDATQANAAGVRIEKVRRETGAEPLRTVATVVPDESRVSHVHTRVSGWIEQLYVNTTGERVRSGQPLAGIFSQELLSTQNEYLAARRAASGGPRSAVLEGARSRLLVLGMTDAEISGIEHTGEARRLVTVTAPRAGVVLRRGISVGTAVDPSTEILTIADLSRVWVLAEVPEADIPRVQVGAAAQLEFPAAAREAFEAKVEFLYPTLSERTRTLRVRFAVDNPAGSLRPGIYGSAAFQVSPHAVLSVSRDAVVDTGDVQHVFVVTGERRFTPRTVKLGARFGDRVEVRDGLREGEEVVASGVFLIDSESRLRASGGGTGHQHGTGSHEQSAPKQPAPRPQPRASKPPASEHEGHTQPSREHTGH